MIAMASSRSAAAPIRANLARLVTVVPVLVRQALSPARYRAAAGRPPDRPHHAEYPDRPHLRNESRRRAVPAPRAPWPTDRAPETPSPVRAKNTKDALAGLRGGEWQTPNPAARVPRRSRYAHSGGRPR